MHSENKCYKKIKATKKNINLFLMTETPFKIIKYSNYDN